MGDGAGGDGAVSSDAMDGVHMYRVVMRGPGTGVPWVGARDPAPRRVRHRLFFPQNPKNQNKPPRMGGRSGNRSRTLRADAISCGGCTHLRFLRQGFCLPPVSRRLWRESREIPAGADGGDREKTRQRREACGNRWRSVIRRRRRSRDAGDAPRGGEAVVRGIRDVPMLYPFTRRSRACRKGRARRRGSALVSRAS